MPDAHKVKQRKKFANAPSFRATARGYFNAIPNFPATAGNANLLLHNRGLNDGDRNHKIWLFCTGINTGWSISGSYGQSASARTYYPNNLAQDEITVQAVVANQYEYDRLVEFIVAHHQRALNTFDHDTDPNTPGQDTAPLELSLFPYMIDTGKKTRKGEIIYREVYGGLPGAGVAGSNGTKVQGYVTAMQAGHDRFVNAKTFQFGFRVSYDFMSKPVHLKGEINKQLRSGYMKSFGAAHNYKPPAAGSGFEGTGEAPQEQPDIWQQAANRGVDPSKLINTRK